VVTQEPVAITGMGVVLPGASGVDRYWHNLLTGTDAITAIPEHRRDPEFHGAAGTGPDRTHGWRGGFVADTVELDSMALGIPPADIAGMELDQLTALAAASAAIEDAGGIDVDRGKVGVILGRGGYISSGLVGFEQRVRTVRQIVRTVRELVPLADPATLDGIRDALLEPLGDFRTESAIGLVPNLAASRVANRLDLGGPAYTIDAACASSLIAVDNAITELGRGRCDVVLAGGVHHCHDDTLWSMFTQIGALSPSQQIRPLSRDADGLLIGEGTAVLLLKRLADARRDGNRVYAVIRGAGVSSDGRGTSVLSPSVHGQVLALRRAWAAAGLDPRQPGAIGLLEAHGTATKAGDTAELATMTEVFGPPDGAGGVVGSVKSMIGHTMPAAGAAGLVKVALSLHHKVLPPTLHCAEPNPALARTRFRVIGEAEEWRDGPAPRRAAVNAFGFGGVNAHVIVEAADTARRRVDVREPDRVLRLAADTSDELAALLDRPQQTDVLGGGRARVGIVDPTPARLAVARRVVAKVARDGAPQRGVQGIWCTVDPLLPAARTAFLFPGLEADVSPQCADIARHFGLPAPRWSTATVLDHAESVTAVGLLVNAALGRIGIAADAVAGHSLGEWTAMRVAGMYTPEPTAELIDRYWSGEFSLPDTDYLVLGCPAAVAERLAARAEAVISHDNAPQQTIACGAPDAVRRLAEICREHGVITRALPFRSGFHTPFLRPHLTPFVKLADDLALRPPAVPVWSATSLAPYPTDPAAVRRLYVDHLLHRVRFRELIETLHGRGFRVFLQLGAGQLGSFVTDTLGPANHLVIGTAANLRPGLDQLRRVATALWVEGGSPRFEALEPHRVRLNTVRPQLSLPAHSRGILATTAGDEVPPGLPDAVAAEYRALLAETRRSAAGVIAALTTPRSISDEVTSTVDVSLDAMPHLRDHRFFRQRPGWPDESDFWPVVPATALIDIACRQVEWAWPGARAAGIRDATFSRWLIADPAKAVPVTMSRKAADRVEVAIGDYTRMTVCLGDRFPAAPQRRSLPTHERPSPYTASEVYDRRAMFHGPAYQGLSKVHGIGSHHVRGDITVPPGPGALLDNIGQLLGVWILATCTDSLLAFPRSIASITWHEPEPGPGTTVGCEATVATPRPDLLQMEANLVLDGRVIATVEGWQDIRFPCDEDAYRARAFPETHLLSTMDDGRATVRDRWPGVAAREFFAGLYLSSKERAAYAACPPREQRGWLLRRIAIKDAVRARLAGVYPAEIFVHEDEKSVSGLHGRILPDLTVGVALHGDTAVATADSPDHATRSAT
jgi:acyl transferase domain-containing protein